MKKDEENNHEIVEKISDIYEVGSFAQIQEMQDLGDKLRIVVTAHRRIKIVGQLFEDLVETPVTEKGKYSQSFSSKSFCYIKFVVRNNN